MTDPGMRSKIILAFDADDTLWVNEPIYSNAENEFSEIVKPYLVQENAGDLLYKTEMENLRSFGYGIKGFILSMIETAIDISKGLVTADEIERIILMGKEMIHHPVEVLDGVKESLNELSNQYGLMMITKGDLFDQESKIARSGLHFYFSEIEIVSEKNEKTYSDLLQKHKIAQERFIMVGNSVKSDILPVCAIGAQAIHIPFHTTWKHEEVTAGTSDPIGYYQLKDIRQLPEFLESLLL